ncbi:hypothetical protein FF80_03319 [Devosia sp. LC5]|uniref:hypothetical protein n=1 Tax=Devosia sp. LC5 TaxID=1502724 RepID=UPI0004E37327|nr:hypothetical protein [Devosia sp. LC5]KFC62752.1 hypothetical protein FF80_03319 [Devosia sp. LC5]
MTDLCANDLEPETLVSKAKEWAIALWERAEDLEGLGSENAMHTAARWAGVTPGLLWRLRYRRPTTIDASPFLKLQNTYSRLINSVEGKSAENLIALRALPPTPARARLIRQLEEFLGIAPGEAPRPIAERAA